MCAESKKTVSMVPQSVKLDAGQLSMLFGRGAADIGIQAPVLL
jgi:hypothetical protein